MSEQDKIDEKTKNAFKTRKAQVKKAFDAGKLMKEEFDDAEANGLVRKRGRIEKSTDKRRMKREVCTIAEEDSEKVSLRSVRCGFDVDVTSILHDSATGPSI